MTIEVSSALGFTAALPEGSARVEESSAGPGTEQFSLPGGAYFSIVRDDGIVHDYAQTIEWTQKMAGYYQKQFDGQLRTEGQLASAGKQSYAVAVAYADADEVPRVATVTGIHFPGQAFFGLTLLTIDTGTGTDVSLVQEILDGIKIVDDAGTAPTG